MELVKNIEEDRSRLLKIKGELLDLSQVESGNIQLKLAPANPNEIIDFASSSIFSLQNLASPAPRSFFWPLPKAKEDPCRNRIKDFQTE